MSTSSKPDISTTTNPLSRRNFIRNTAVTAAATYFIRKDVLAELSSDFVAHSRTANANNKITTIPLRRNVSVLSGAGGNIAVLTAKEGKLVVDSGYASCQPQLSAAVAALKADPIRVLINTHWHLDHTDGNEWMHAAGATIWAHENTRYRLTSTQHIAFFNATIPPAPVGALPTILINTSRTISDSISTLHLNHYEPAHTDTDLSVHFTEADILHCGDTWFNGFYPFIDYSSGGNINGMIVAAAQNLTLATDTTMLIPGHGPVGNKAQLTEFHDMLVGVRDKVAALKKQGLTLEATTAAKPTAPYDAKFGAGMLKPDVFVTLVYAGV
jgi:glyoxylase-like metal-dependent hydrolase (beta-lactamase superfamily II)